MIKFKYKNFLLIMHGVKKSDYTAKRLTKIKQNVIKYKKLNSFTLQQKKKKIYNEEMLETCAQILSINGEHYTVWNYRREILLFIFNDAVKNKKQELLDIECALIEKCLKRNPKSYSAFFQREWCINCLDINHDFISLAKELLLCSAFLAMDARNFHCWDYRRFIVKKALEHKNKNENGHEIQISLKSELKYTSELIGNNFSNYSAWHYRSTLIPEIYESKNDSSNGKQRLHRKIVKELDFAKNAFYTEPGDQSAWLYHRWLLFGMKGFASHEQLLESELVSCEKLIEFEPNAKWALLTSIVLIQALLKMKDTDDSEIREERTKLVNQRIAQLIELDSDRAQYYVYVQRLFLKEINIL